jgi:hypothetical protein
MVPLYLMTRVYMIEADYERMKAELDEQKKKIFKEEIAKMQAQKHQLRGASVQGACKALLAVETQTYGNFNHTNAIYTTIHSLVKGQIAPEFWNEPIPSECYIIHKVAMASHQAERRAIQDWRDAVHAEKSRQPTFEELLVFCESRPTAESRMLRKYGWKCLNCRLSSL